MIRFSKEKVLLLHQLMTEATGGDVGVRDEALLESAIENVYSTFDGAKKLLNWDYQLPMVLLISPEFLGGYMNIKCNLCFKCCISLLKML